MSKAIGLVMPGALVTGRRAASAPFGQLLRLWVQRARQRRELAELTREQLHDVGITPEAAQREAAKPFWQA